MPNAAPATPATEQSLPVGDFQALPLDFMVAAPLLAVVRAQKEAALSTKEFITSFMTPASDNPSRMVPQTVSFNLNYQEKVGTESTTKQMQLDVPLLSIVPVPHMRFDSLTTHFKYEVSQIVGKKRDTSGQGEVSAGIKYLPFLDASLKGSLATSSSEQSTTNRSGCLEITLHASEAPMPEGLARLLSWLSHVVQAPPA